MTRFARTALALMLAFYCRPQAALAQIGEGGSAAAAAAASELIEAVRTTADAPRLSDPEMDALFDRALPEGAASGPVPDVDELARLIGASAWAGKIVRAYVLAGTGAGEAGVLTIQQRERARLNFLAYLPEISRLYDYRLLVAARLSEGAAQITGEGPASDDAGVRSGVEAITAETGAILAAILSFVADGNIDREVRLGRMRLLGENAPRFAAFLETKPAQAIADQALAAAIVENDPELGALLKDFALAILR